jgi:carbon-monoxide dehydrogenase medium subunit
MIPANFDYIAAKSLDEALSLLAKHKDDAKILAGGHSLLPAMKLRLMQPKVLIDLGRIRYLSYIK